MLKKFQTIRNIKLTIQYDGTDYSGWQFQKNGPSIQETVQNAIKKITGGEVCVRSAGRTDAGVHAEGQVANFKTSSRIPANKLQMALNSALPEDIVIARLEEADPGFNAQRDARSKVYRYTIVNNDFVNPLLRRFAAKCFYALDMAAMKRAARYLKGRHDFKAFQAKDDVERNAVCVIKTLSIEKDGDLVYIYIEADRFVYNMARNIVGTMVEAGRGKISADAARTILRKKERRLCGPTMPARGLCLVKVKY